MTTTPQSMSDDELPLPAAGYGQGTNIPLEIGQPLFTADQLHAVRAQAFHDGQVAGRATAEQAGKVEVIEATVKAAWAAYNATQDELDSTDSLPLMQRMDVCMAAALSTLAKPTQPAATQECTCHYTAPRDCPHKPHNSEPDHRAATQHGTQRPGAGESPLVARRCAGEGAVSELLPCPFCGSESGPMMVCDVADWPSVVCSTSFGGCGASSGYCPAGDDNAIAAWNLRPPMQASEARGEQDALVIRALDACGFIAPGKLDEARALIASLSKAHTQAGESDGTEN